MKHVLFYIRLVLFLLAVSMPLIHPAVVVSYDRIGMFFWFFLLPVEILIAFYLAPPRLALRTWLLIALGLALIFVLFISGFTLASLAYVAGAGAAVLSTLLIFRRKIIVLGVLEQLFLAFLYYKLIGFSRSSESAAAESAGLIQVLLVLLICSFLLYGLTLYLSAFHQAQGRRGRRELVLFAALAVPVVLTIALLLPPDFVRHTVVFNRIDKDIKPKPFPLDEQGQGLEGGNLRSDKPLGEENGEGENGGDQEPGESSETGASQLEGIPSDQWDRIGQGQGNKQYAVMVVASPKYPLYAAGAYYGHFDPVQGFQLSHDEPLNELSYRRLLETWTDDASIPDRRRRAVEIFTLSTLPERYLAYRPHAVEPTILNRAFHPFDFSFNTVSRISDTEKRDWLRISGLSEGEKAELQDYLEISLPPSSQESFVHHLRQAVGETTGYYGRIEKILRSFSTYQYELGFNDNVQVAKMENFLVRTRRGDCTEFSNSTAILSRLAGIPARVVTGYLVSRQLQTPVHLQGTFMLRQAVKPLQKYPLNQLVLVTTAHRHSWVQLYLSGYGWVDFETTAYALPPLPGKDLNALDVVIPLIQGEDLTERRPQIPWKTVLLVVFSLAAGTLLLLYLYRYAREIYLGAVSRGQDPKALRALLTLLLMKLSANGYDLKSPAQTPLEYAARYPGLHPFALLYTRLRFRDWFTPEERALHWQQLRERYRHILDQARAKGLKNGLKRLFSLKGLYYGWSLYWG